MQALATTPKNEIEFVPFGGDEKIKLNIAIVQKFVAIPTKSGKLPEERDCIRFMMLCRARKLNPFEGDCFLQGYDGRDGAQFSLITAHQAFLKRAEVNPEYDGMESGVIVSDENGAVIEREGDFTMPDDKLLGGWAVVHFKSRKHAMKRKLALRTFDKGFGRWQDDKAGMIVKCAEADALRSSFPTMLGGLYSAGEVQAAIAVESTVVTTPKAPDFTPKALPPAKEPSDDGDLGPSSPATKPEAPQTPKDLPGEPSPLEALLEAAKKADVQPWQIVKFAQTRGYTKADKLDDFGDSLLMRLKKPFDAGSKSVAEMKAVEV